MKNIQTILVLMLTFISCKAQNPILDISDIGLDHIDGAYYKDTHDLLNPFVGTYIYTNGSTSFKIVLQKKTMSSMNGVYYEDLIIGEYQYIENGVEILNTLNNFNVNYTNGTDYNIDGNFIITGKSLGCDECADDEKRLRIGLSDRPVQRTAELDIRRINQIGQQSIKVELWWTGRRTRNENDPPRPAPRIPAGTYVMIKQ